jgi:hypothetical protein
MSQPPYSSFKPLTNLSMLIGPPKIQFHVNPEVNKVLGIDHKTVCCSLVINAILQLD